MRGQRNTFNAYLQQMLTVGPLADNAVPRKPRVMVLVRSADKSKINRMSRRLPLLGAVLTKQLIRIALRITSMRASSFLPFAGRTGNPRPHCPTICSLEGLLLCSMYWRLNE